MFSGTSDLTDKVDAVTLFVLGVGGILMVAITVLMIYFVFKYHRKNHPKPVQLEDSITLEVVWTLIPLAIVMVMFYFGYRVFKYMRTVPDGALVVKATGQMYTWKYTYPNGKVTTEALVLPLGKPVKVEIESIDVLHSFYVPAFRVKEDAVPGLSTYVTFTPEKIGEYRVFCAEYCGVGHSAMLSEVKVVTPQEYEVWLKGGGTVSDGESIGQPASASSSVSPTKEKVEPVQATGEGDPARGKQLVTAKGCVACHSVDGTKILGPSFKGLFGRKIVVKSGGKERSLIADEEYIRRSIKDPNADIVEGFTSPSMMPPQPLTDSEIADIVSYIKTLR